MTTTHKILTTILIGFFAVRAQSTTLAEAIDSPNASISDDRVVTADQSQPSGYCVRSSNQGQGSSSSSLILTLSGPGEISFKRMVSGEGGGYDYLWYKIDDGSEIARRQTYHGRTSLETVTHDSTGSGTHTWTDRFLRETRRGPFSS